MKTTLIYHNNILWCVERYCKNYYFIIILSYLDSGSDLTGHLLPAAESRAHRSLSAAAVITASAAVDDDDDDDNATAAVVDAPPPLPPPPPARCTQSSATMPARCQRFSPSALHCFAHIFISPSPLHVLQRCRWRAIVCVCVCTRMKTEGTCAEESNDSLAPKNLGCRFTRKRIPDDAAKSIY